MLQFYRCNYGHARWLPHLYLNDGYFEIEWLLWLISYTRSK